MRGSRDCVKEILGSVLFPLEFKNIHIIDAVHYAFVTIVYADALERYWEIIKKI